jgi:flagellar hook assembly protein FlgD
MAPRLLPASPNPMTSTTTLAFDLPGATDVTLRIYDITGRLVRELAAMHLPAGRHEMRWDGRDSSGRLLARGVYVARLEADGIVRTHKISVTR